MSKIKMDIEHCMHGLTNIDLILTSGFMFTAEFIGFQGHFPVNKVLPGACQIQCVISTIEKALDKHVVLKEIVLAKYIALIHPGDNVICTVSGLPETGNEFVCKARIMNGTEKASDMKLLVCLSDKI